MSTLYIIADRVFFSDPTFCGIFVCGPLPFKCQFITYFGAVGLLKIGYAVHFCVVLPMFLRLVLYIPYFGDTWCGVVLLVLE